MSGLRALPFAVFGALAWFLWTTTGQSTGACFSYAQYVASAATAFVVIVVLAVATDLLVASRAHSRGSRPFSLSSLAVMALAPASLTAVGLAVAVFFSAVVSCSGG